MHFFVHFSCTVQKKSLPLQRKGQNSQTATAMTTLTPEQKEAQMASMKSFDDTLRVDDLGESK